MFNKPTSEVSKYEWRLISTSDFGIRVYIKQVRLWEQFLKPTSLLLTQTRCQWAFKFFNTWIWVKNAIMMCLKVYYKNRNILNACAKFSMFRVGFVQQKLELSFNFRCDLIRSNCWYEFGHTLLSNLSLTWRSAKLWLRWVCSTSKSELSSTTKCDQNHNFEHNEFGNT